MEGNLNDELSKLTKIVNNFQHIQRFVEIIDLSEFPIYVGYSHPDGKWTYVNQRFADDMGYTKEEMCSIPWIKMVKKNERDGVLGDYEEFVEKDEKFTDYHTTYITKDGSEIDIIWYTSSLHTEPDNLTLCIGLSGYLNIDERIKDSKT